MAIYTHDSLEKSVIEVNSDINFEKVCRLELKLRGGDRMLFGSFYRCPSPTDISAENNNNLNKPLMNIANKSYSHKCLVGDFNFKDINWETWTTFHNEESKETKFIEVGRDCFLFQHNQQNPRKRGNDAPSLIAFIFTDEEMQVSEIEHQSPLGKSDHNVITFRFHCYLDYTKSKDRYAYEKYEEMKKEVTDTNWEEEFIASANDNNIEEHWVTLKSRFIQLRDKFVSITKSSVKPPRKKLGGFPIGRILQTRNTSELDVREKTWQCRSLPFRIHKSKK